MSATFFSIVYIKPNAVSEERIAFALIGSNNGVPFFVVNDKKMNFGLSLISNSIRPLIRKSMRLMEFDLNKYRLGLESLPLFDQPLSKKFLTELVAQKRGKIDYSPIINLENTIDLEKLVSKYLGGFSLKSTNKKNTFKIDLKGLLSHKKLDSFRKNAKLNPSEFNTLMAPYKVELFRKTSFITLFKWIDLNTSSSVINRKIESLTLLVQGLKMYSVETGLGKGRYYLVVPKNQFADHKKNILELTKKNHQHFEIITSSEVLDKI